MASHSNQRGKIVPFWWKIHRQQAAGKRLVRQWCSWAKFIDRSYQLFFFLFVFPSHALPRNFVAYAITSASACRSHRHVIDVFAYDTIIAKPARRARTTLVHQLPVERSISRLPWPFLQEIIKRFLFVGNFVSRLWKLYSTRGVNCGKIKTAQQKPPKQEKNTWNMCAFYGKQIFLGGIET